jgi:hypothetical protein
MRREILVSAAMRRRKSSSSEILPGQVPCMYWPKRSIIGNRLSGSAVNQIESSYCPLA